MKAIVRFFSVLAVAALMACGSSGTGPEDENPTGTGITGSWRGFYFEMTSQADPSVSVDLVQYGVAYSITINADSSYTASTTFLGSTVEENGVLQLSGNNITMVSPQNGTFNGTYTLSGDTLSMNLSGMAFDFDQDGTSEAADLSTSLLRTN